MYLKRKLHTYCRRNDRQFSVFFFAFLLLLFIQFYLMSSSIYTMLGLNVISSRFNLTTFTHIQTYITYGMSFLIPDNKLGNAMRLVSFFIIYRIFHIPLHFNFLAAELKLNRIVSGSVNCEFRIWFCLVYIVVRWHARTHINVSSEAHFSYRHSFMSVGEYDECKSKAACERNLDINQRLI